MSTRELFPASPQLVFAFDARREISFLDASGLGIVLFPGDRPLAILSELIPSLESDLDRVLAGESLESRITFGRRPIRLRYRPLTSPDGAVRGGIALGFSQSAEAGQDRMIEKNDERRHFELVANLSHEIRTPLNAILGMAELLAASRLDREQFQQVKALQRAGEGLLRLANEVMDLAKLDAGKMSVEAIAFDLRETVVRAMELAIGKASSKSLPLYLEMDEALPSRVVGDPHRLQQVLLNLLDNAVKFTARGEVRIAVTKDTGEGVAFAVVDTGIGISAEKQQLVFESFTQADASTTRRYGGSGLGLGIARGLVELMGGHIQLESRVDQGTTVKFTLSLPAASESVALAPQPKPIPPAVPRRILLADDSEDNRLLIVNFLKGLPYELTIAENGRAAVEAFARGNFDTVLMDVQMPELDGYVATREIRKLEQSLGRPQARILALTAHALPEDFQRSAAAGCDGHLTKPISRERLCLAIEGEAPTKTPAPPVADVARPFREKIYVDVPRGLFHLVPDMLARRRQDLVALQVALAASDFEAISRIGHRLRGEAGSYGFHHITALGSELEQLARNQDRDRIQAALSRFDDYLSRCVARESYDASA